MKIDAQPHELNLLKKMLIAAGKDYSKVQADADRKGITLDSETKIKDDLSRIKDKIAAKTIG
jgi:hypothetical protein